MASSEAEESSLDTSLTEPSLATTTQSSLDLSQSFETTKTSVATTEEEDDDDDELLALRIAALESIKLKEKKSAPVAEVVAPPPTVDLRPSYVITAHPARNNLVSIITEHQEIENTLAPVVVPNYPPPPIRRSFNSPPPSPVPYRSPPFRPRYRSRSRSFERRRSFSPGGGRSPPRYRSPYRSPPRWRSPGRRSPLPPLVRRSPPPLRRSPNGLRRSPLRRSPGRKSPMRRSPPRQRSPMRRSPLRRGPRPVLLPTPPSESEWETDSDPPTDDDENKENVDNKPNKDTKDNVENKEEGKDTKEGGDIATEDGKEKGEETKDDGKPDENESKEETKKLDETDQSQDDILKLDATAEVDEFSKFLNEFEDELEDKKPAAAVEEKPPTAAKKTRIETERKTLDGKKLRKKIKVKKDRTPSLSPEGGRWRRGRRESPFRRSPNSRGRNNRQSPFGKKAERGSWPRDDKVSREEEEKERREKEEQEERARKEYEERLSKLSSPERKRLEARRRKFDSKKEVSLSEPKKISLRTESSELVLGPRRDELGPRRDLKRVDKEDGLSLDTTTDSVDVEEGGEYRKRVREQSQSPPRKKHVTDLRVQLHKRKQAKESVENGSALSTKRREPSPRRRNHSAERRDYSPEVEEPDLDDEPPVLPMKGRVIVPPVSSGGREEESPSPPADRRNLQDNRRILVRRKSASSASPEENATKISPKKKTLKTSLLSRLGDKLDTSTAVETTPDTIEFTEEEIWAEMIRQKNKKLKKKIKKEEKKEKKVEKKEKKKKKSLKSLKEKKVVEEKEEGEEGEEDDIFNYFEEMSPVHQETKQRTKSRTSSGDSMRLDWSPVAERSRNTSGAEVNVRDRLGDKVEADGDIAVNKPKRKAIEKMKKVTKEELDLSVEGEDILKKMKRRNEKRIARLKEIERDKLMFS